MFISCHDTHGDDKKNRQTNKQTKNRFSFLLTIRLQTRTWAEQQKEKRTLKKNLLNVKWWRMKRNGQCSAITALYTHVCVLTYTDTSSRHNNNNNRKADILIENKQKKSTTICFFFLLVFCELFLLRVANSTASLIEHRAFFFCFILWMIAAWAFCFYINVLMKVWPGA